MSTFEIVRGVEGDCLVLNDTRICGPKPWGGGRIIKTFRTDGVYEVIDKDEYRKLMAENAKLRELAHLVAEYMSADQCEGCVAKRACNAGELDMCWIRKAILEKLHELGVEVGG